MNVKYCLLKIWNLWPPFLFSGIKIIKRSPDFRYFAVKLKLRFWNSNYLGTQYGGSIFSMTDAFYMIMLINNLGKEYTVWDKAASIRFLKQGRTNLYAEFKLSEEDLTEIRQEIEKNNRMNWVRKVVIKDEKDEIIAEVERVISIKKSKNCVLDNY